jgi:hypothetical protein
MGTWIQTESWDLVTNSSGFSTDGSTEASPAAAPTMLSPQDPTVAPASSSPLNYYVRFTLSDGAVVTVNGAQFFALDGFSFSEQPSSSTGSQSGSVATILAHDARGRWASSGRLAAHAALSNKSAMTTAWPRIS